MPLRLRGRHTRFVIRRFRHSDVDAVLALNAANVPEVGPMDRTKLDLLEDAAALFAVVELDGSIEGALVVLEEGSAYASPNYRWFSDRHDEFAYVDRIMLSPATRGMGWGIKLYDAGVSTARRLGKGVLTAEVNTEPPNPRSVRFHEAFGFVEVGRERPYGPHEEVAMFELIL